MTAMTALLHSVPGHKPRLGPKRPGARHVQLSKLDQRATIRRDGAREDARGDDQILDRMTHRLVQRNALASTAGRWSVTQQFA